ncbi:ATP-binding cassette domain-containing protein [Methylococcus sp. EFPC2]|uniref:ATP-binding cassette domain-containing protein n=1 Tax=Methylococcus sp. EFPC2 TaxID=2812648 RepID=UPI0019687E4D|nr:ATP-binding cassette domain-containing protein [Methylococcus sp. EFPC2]QSA98596.1 ATP-binding cassette domain-containing protein [Methylococcus sp. EFPC2]
MINFKSLALRRGVRLLFEHASLTLHAGNKVGVVGANGAGKSSLFALFLGELLPDAGTLELPPGLVLAHVAQETPADSRPAIEYVLDGDRELRTLEAELKQAEQAHDGLHLAQLHARFEHIGGYQARSRAARLMSGLGFQAGDEDRPVTDFSGGWRMRINLAQALMCRSDLLLLDEPTNHLDLDAVLWLQDWLSTYPGTLLLISHDRDFLDAVTDRIVHLENQVLTVYTGNYSAFEVRRAELLAQRQAAYDRQQREIAHIRSFVDRFRAQATKARQAQSRIKALARMEVIAQAHADSPFDFAFQPPAKLPRPLLRVREASVGHGQKRILENVDLTLAPGDRIGLLGPNGAGKSTLIKTLAGDLPLLAGERIEAQDLKLGYFAQHQIEQLRMDESPLRHFQRLDTKASEKDLRNFLGGFGFQGDAAMAEIAPFSGGEKARLALALLVYQRPNLLLLDEPTNHLDLEMRYALSRALQDFEGALVVVSHDRYLLRTVADEFWLAHDGRVEPFEGDLEDYRKKLAASGAPSPAALETGATALSRKDQRRLDADKRQQLRPLQQALQKAESELDKLGQERHQMESALADPGLYEPDGKDRLQALLRDKARVDRALAAAENAWLEAGEALEAAQQVDAA